MRCLECGGPIPAGAGRCPACGAPAPQGAPGGGPPAGPAHGPAPARRDPGPGGIGPWPAPRPPAAAPAFPRPPRGRITGRVIAIEGPHTEAADFDPARALARILWMLLAVAAPFAIAGAAFEAAGPVAALIVGLFFLFALRWLSPANLFALFHLAVLLNPLGRRAPDGQPVRHLRIRDTARGGEHIVRVKGTLPAGNIMPDDLLTVWGPVRAGVLHARAAYNHRTRAAVAVDRQRAWKSLFAALLAALLLASLLADPLARLIQAAP